MFGMTEIDATTLARRLEEDPDGLRLLDIRSPQEMAQGMIPGGEPLPMHLIPLQERDLIASDRPIVLYCRSGARSAQACMYLISRGADPERIINLRGGIIDWARAGLPLAAPPADSAIA